MEKRYRLFPLEDENLIGEYDDPQGDYCDQFNIPFLRECADYIDADEDVTIRLVITAEGDVLYITQTKPTSANYLGDIDDSFSNTLWSYRDRTISVKVTIIRSTPTPSVP
jgi:hypothetical protein